MTTKDTTFNRLKHHLGDTDPALEVVSAEKGLQRHWLSGTWSVDLAIHCWCGRSHRLDTLGWRRMVEGFNRFCREHTHCEPRDTA